MHSGPAGAALSVVCEAPIGTRALVQLAARTVNLGRVGRSEWRWSSLQAVDLICHERLRQWAVPCHLAAVGLH